jgi:hypothetical protein
MVFFFNCNANDIFHAVQGNNFLSSTSKGHLSRGEIKGMGYYISTDEIAVRRSITLYSVRSLVKSNWMNTDNVYIGKE